MLKRTCGVTLKRGAALKTMLIGLPAAPPGPAAPTGAAGPPVVPEPPPFGSVGTSALAVASGVTPCPPTIGSGVGTCPPRIGRVDRTPPAGGGVVPPPRSPPTVSDAVWPTVPVTGVPTWLIVRVMGVRAGVSAFVRGLVMPPVPLPLPPVPPPPRAFTDGSVSFALLATGVITLVAGLAAWLIGPVAPPSRPVEPDAGGPPFVGEPSVAASVFVAGVVACVTGAAACVIGAAVFVTVLGAFATGAVFVA